MKAEVETGQHENLAKERKKEWMKKGMKFNMTLKSANAKQMLERPIYVPHDY